LEIERRDSFSSSPFTCLIVQANKILMGELGSKNQMNSAPLQFRDAFRERRDRFRMRMPDGNGRAVTFRVAGGKLELRQHRCARGGVVEKDFS